MSGKMVLNAVAEEGRIWRRLYTAVWGMMMVWFFLFISHPWIAFHASSVKHSVELYTCERL